VLILLYFGIPLYMNTVELLIPKMVGQTFQSTDFKDWCIMRCHKFDMK
jgi:hypothetical protein